MSIEAYLQALLATIAATPNVHSSDVALDQRSTQSGLIRGDIYFADGSLLHFRELIDLETEPIRLMYSYHYQRADSLLVFRYDDTPHHPELPNFPHHRHGDHEPNVVAAAPPDLSTVLKEIERFIALED